MKPIIARLTAGILLALAAMVLTAAPASALSAYTTTAVAVAFTLDPQTVVQLVIAFVLPVAVGLVTTRVTKSGRKAWLLASLSLVTSLLLELARALSRGETYDIGVALLAALPAFVVSVSSHYGLWKPTGVADKVADLLRTAKPEVQAQIADGEHVWSAEDIRRAGGATAINELRKHAAGGEG